MSNKIYYLILYLFSLTILIAFVIISLKLNKESKLKADYFSDICFIENGPCVICDSINKVYFNYDTAHKEDNNSNILNRLKCEGIIKSFRLFPGTLYYIKKNNDIIYTRSSVLINNSKLKLNISYNCKSKCFINIDDLRPFVFLLQDKIESVLHKDYHVNN